MSAFWVTAQNQQVKKYITIELFTNTWCGLCAYFDPPAIDTYMQNKASVHLISVHPNVPYAACPFYNANPTDNLARRTFYGSFNSTPRTFTNGTQENRNADMITQSLIDANSGQYSPLRIEVIENGFFTSKTVDVYVKSFATPPSGDLRLYVANVVELVDFEAQNGLTEHHNVLWQFLTSENGDAITFTDLDQTVSRTFQYNTNNLSHESFEGNQVYTIAFVQNNNTKEIINSGSSKDIIIDATITDTTCGVADGAIDLDIRGGTGNYTIFWMEGGNTDSINSLTEGTYTVVVTDNAGASVTNKFIVNSMEDLTLEDDHNVDRVYQAGSSITSTASIFADIEYKAGERITLDEGFTTNNPFDFNVEIEGCD